MTVKTGADYQVQAAVVADLDRLMDIETRSHYHPWSRATMSRYLERNGVIWKLVDPATEQLVAFAVVTQIAGEAELLTFAVEPDLRGRGLGQQLLQQMLDMVEQGGCSQMFLEVRESNAAAIAVYEKLGFCQVGVRPNYYPASNGREDALLYCQELLA